MAGLALDDIRVLDLTQQFCGPYATKLLADYGADVIKIEPPTGDPARMLRPFAGDTPDREKSGLFAWLNTNKRSITLDLEQDEGRAAVLDLVRTADIVVENFRPGTLDRLGLGYAQLQKVRANTVLLSISNFGQTGPYRDWNGSELVLYAMGGEMYSMGLLEKGPIKMAGTAALFESGSAAAVAGMGAVYGAKWGGEGAHLDISVFETQAGGVDRRHAAIIGYEFAGRVSERSASGTSLGFPMGTYPCADGFIEIAGTGPRWPSTVAMLGSPPDLLGPEWTQPGAAVNPELREIFDGVFYPWLLERTKLEIWKVSQQFHVLCSPLYTMEDLFHDPAFRERGFFIEVEHPAIGRFTMPGRPFIMSESPWTLRRPAPLLGQHTDEVLAELGYDTGRIAALRSANVV